MQRRVHLLTPRLRLTTAANQTLISTDGKIFIYELLDTGASCLKVIDGLVAPSKVE